MAFVRAFEFSLRMHSDDPSKVARYRVTLAPEPSGLYPDGSPAFVEHWEIQEADWFGKPTWRACTQSALSAIVLRKLWNLVSCGKGITVDNNVINLGLIEHAQEA